MDRECTRIQEHLVEAAGVTGRLSEADRAHLEACTSCAEAAALEPGLQRVLEEAVAPADPEHVARILAAVARAGRRRRVLALAPVAASLAIAVLGAAMLGGVPGGSLLALLPLWSTQGWMSLLGMAGDWQVVASATARSLPELVTPAMQGLSFTLCLCGLVGVVLSVRRWRSLASWQRGR